MLFTQIEFAIFFLLVLLGCIFVKNHRAHKSLLLIASYYFYGYWDWRFLGLIFLLTVINYSAGCLLDSAKNERIHKWVVAIAISLSLLILGVFKYYNFFADSLSALLAPLGLRVGSLRIILPVGISFYTFQTLSYTIDVYRRSLKHCRNFFDFALFVSFFPQLVAGPIVRAADFLPQLESPREMSRERFFYGSKQFIFGFFKKVFIADRLATFVDYSFQNAGLFDGASTWLAVVSYSIQIYCDFSGYSDMAIGAARILGYDFIKNFDHPYLAVNITDFWRRWHISLSSWLRDYLYIPLGGNRKGVRRTYINLILTMVLGGLWHGASWSFVVWGAAHGAGLAIHKWVMARFGQRVRKRWPQTLFGWLFTMLFVLNTWVLFRAGSFSQAMLMYRQMYSGVSGITWFYPFAFVGILFMLIAHGAFALKKGALLEFSYRSWYGPFVLFMLLFLTLIFYPQGFSPFIYFQF